MTHSARAHATWAASATARNWHCPGALALSQGVVDRESEAAAWGTACHQISEKCLRSGKDATDFIGETEGTERFKFEVDDEMATTAQEYVDYVRKTVSFNGDRDCEATLWIEERFSLTDLNPPFDAGGTGDAVIYKPYGKAIEIVDLKGGRGVVVDATGNPQLRTYALGALLAHTSLDVATVTVTIVQPRAPHKDGRIRSETFDVGELVIWTTELLAAMKRSKQAMDEFVAVGSNTVLLDEWRDKWLRPGKCTFCPVEGSCPALKRDALSVASVWFDDQDKPQIGNAALDMTPEKMAQTLDLLPMLEDWVKAVRAFAHTQAEQGVEIPGYQLADKIGNRKWSDGTLEALVTTLHGAGLPNDELYVDPKLKSPAQMEKMLGSKRKALIEPFVTREVTGTNLVSSAKSTRPPAKTVAERFFET